ncbi:alpha/beta fold hydrolase [Actinomadura macra]|uniref:alpha/beta fold hydrolase n=1 Tax=Actinomadura macra TaxID=46164 RepID=UPI000830BB2E|nr:alpha/beta fold hydrolase [Actinomadura macra]
MNGGLLLLHGLAGGRLAWAPLRARLPEDLPVWSPELPWSAGEGPRWDHRADPVRILADAMTASASGGVPDVVVAHSYAANVLLTLLADRTRPRPSAVVLVAPFYRASEQDFTWPEMTRYMDGFLPLIDEGLRLGSAGRLSGEVRESMATRVRDRLGPYGWIRFFDAYLRTPFLDTAALDLPVLIVGGEQDPAARPQDARALAAALPDCRLELLPSCGHNAMIEHPDRFAVIVREFLARFVPRIRKQPEPI